MTRRALIWLVVSLAIITACRVHESPVGESHVNVALTLSFQEDLPLYSELEYKTKAAGDLQLRHTLRMYHATGTNRWSETPDIERVVYGKELKDVVMDLRLEPIRYYVMVWTDYVDAAANGLFYNPTDFHNIRIPEGNYLGASPGRDAFCGAMVMDLSTVLEADAHIDRTLPMTRPVAKYSIVATDKDVFLRMFLDRLKDRLRAEGQETKAEQTKVEDIDPSIFRVVVAYSGFLPDTWNLWQGRPVDSRTGVRYESGLRELSDGNMEMAYDFVLVNGQESAVSIQIYIYDDRGDILGTVQTDIPLHMGMRTVLKGKFLTSGAASGISIDPGFEGEFNIKL